MGDAARIRAAVERVVQDHAGWVFAAAKRRVRDAALAEDVTQAVFLLYWRKGVAIGREAKLTGWLYRAVRYCSANALRLKKIRQRHEREAAMERKEGQSAGWSDVEAALEGAVDRLSEKDRQAVVLRFYRGLGLREVGEAVGIGEDAARKRVDRAVGKLREMLAARGVEAETAGLSGLLLAHAGEGGPVGLVEKVVAGIGNGMGNGTAGGIAKGAGKMMALAKVKLAVGVLLAAVTLGIPAVYVVAADHGPKVVAVPEPATREVVEILDGAPSLSPTAAELLRTVVALRKHNNGRVLTWQGKAQVTSRTRSPKSGRLDTTASIEFTLDMPHESLLWRKQVTQAQRTQNGVLTDLPEALEATSMLRNQDGLYELSPLIIKPGGVREDALVIWPADLAKTRTKEKGDFDPRMYLLTWEGQDIEELLSGAYEAIRKNSSTGQRIIEQQGQRVIYRHVLKDLTWTYTFDLEKGGSLVAAEMSGPGHHNRYEYEFVQVGGVWLPSVYRAESKPASLNGEAARQEEVRFSEHLLNTDLPNSAFSLEALGVREGCAITDRRIGREYVAGENHDTGEAEDGGGSGGTGDRGGRGGEGDIR